MARGASKSPTGSKLRRQKDQDMASMMKRLGIRRKTCTCPICYKTVTIPFDNFDRHRCGRGA